MSSSYSGQYNSRRGRAPALPSDDSILMRRRQESRLREDESKKYGNSGGSGARAVRFSAHGSVGSSLNLSKSVHSVERSLNTTSTKAGEPRVSFLDGGIGKSMHEPNYAAVDRSRATVYGAARREVPHTTHAADPLSNIGMHVDSVNTSKKQFNYKNQQKKKKGGNVSPDSGTLSLQQA